MNIVEVMYLLGLTIARTNALSTFSMMKFVFVIGGSEGHGHVYLILICIVLLPRLRRKNETKESACIIIYLCYVELMSVTYQAA